MKGKSLNPYRGLIGYFDKHMTTTGAQSYSVSLIPNETVTGDMSNDVGPDTWASACTLVIKIQPRIWGVLCQKQVSRALTSNYIPHYLWDVITCPCPWYLHTFGSTLLICTRPVTWQWGHVYHMATEITADLVATSTVVDVNNNDPNW